MPLDSPEYTKILNAVIEWSKTADLGPLLKNIHIHEDGHVLRWSQVSMMTLRTNHRRRSTPSASYMDQEFPELPYTVTKDGERIYPNKEN